jgi:hypothetical protein
MYIVRSINVFATVITYTVQSNNKCNTLVSLILGTYLAYWLVRGYCPLFITHVCTPKNLQFQEFEHTSSDTILEVYYHSPSLCMETRWPLLLSLH